MHSPLAQQHAQAAPRPPSRPCLARLLRPACLSAAIPCRPPAARALLPRAPAALLPSVRLPRAPRAPAACARALVACARAPAACARAPRLRAAEPPRARATCCNAPQRPACLARAPRVPRPRASRASPTRPACLARAPRVPDRAPRVPDRAPCVPRQRAPRAHAPRARSPSAQPHAQWDWPISIFCTIFFPFFSFLSAIGKYQKKYLFIFFHFPVHQ